MGHVIHRALRSQPNTFRSLRCLYARMFANTFDFRINGTIQHHLESKPGTDDDANNIIMQIIVCICCAVLHLCSMESMLWMCQNAMQHVPQFSLVGVVVIVVVVAVCTQRIPSGKRRKSGACDCLVVCRWCSCSLLHIKLFSIYIYIYTFIQLISITNWVDISNRI